MQRPDETTLVIHGLDVDNRVVRAAVFVQKLRTLLTALSEADKFANGKKSFDYLLPKLDVGSAAATVRERRRRRDVPRSSVSTLEQTATAIYNADRNIVKYPENLVRVVEKLASGVSKTFSHAELGFPGGNVIRIDDFMMHQAIIAHEIITEPHLKQTRFYRGLALGTFNGVLKEIDARGTMLRGKLVLTAGRIEIDCVMNKDRVPEARESFDKRAIVQGTAHYDGANQLPVRLDVRTIQIVKENGDLLRWRGAFKAPVAKKDDEEW